MRRYSTFRNDLPFLVWQRYFTKASSAPVVIRSRSKCPMKSTCVSQHCVLKVLFADVVVAGRARKGEVVGEQHIERAQILLFPRRVPLTDDLFVRYGMPSQCARSCQSG